MRQDNTEPRIVAGSQACRAHCRRPSSPKHHSAFVSDYEGAAAEKKEKGSTYVVDGLLAVPISDEEVAFDLVVGLVDGGGAVLDISYERLAVPAVERLFI